MAPLLLPLLSLISTLYLVAQGQEQPQPIEEEPITAKNIQPLGGWFSRDPESLEVQTAAKAAVDNFNIQSNARKLFRLINVISAETQVTNMINYRIEAIIGKTKCLKTENNSDVESCVLGKKRLTCTFEVWFNPRNDKHEISTTSCQKQI
ncbi:cystatin-1 [Salmo salar]|uniref:Cystatin n=1 Tax=Salmo salar TaxID=8030 RepID=B5XF86_SALSA|nr:cystatin-1 [Salmo salar]XP_014002323.1 cystatin-1 [Salmo salar]ACI69506.1 Cystatin precursor [Salmo salar]ACI69883.1 Cystatin precursor [Salmo salar]ACM09458.1 Cystatin precursor [Salmo salar]ACM09746.1 Cystatin precursor [Salmo salar]ADM15897.1 Cystatin precursor [Salmo salar]|eukprot:XP_014002314.1 PREDICTED: cystatin-1-like [Salmo salar]